MDTQPSQMITDSMAVTVPGKTKIIYGMGAFGTQFFNGVQAAATYKFFFTLMKMDALSWTIIMLVIYNIWNAINDPIFGWISDRTKSKMGRRIPYIRFLTPIWLLTMVLLFVPVQFDQMSMFIWLTVFILLFDGCYTMVAGCYNSLMPELSTSTDERTKVNFFTQIFAIIGVAISFIFPLVLLPETLVSVAQLIPFFIFIIIGGVIALSVLFIPSFFLKEREIPKDKKPLGLIKAIKFSIKNKPFMSFIGWNFMVQFSSSIVILIAIDYSQNVLSATGFMSYLIFGALFISLIPGFLVNKYISQKKGIRYAVFLSTLTIASGLLLLFLAGQIAWLAIISLVIAGFGLSGGLMFANVMIGESSDFDELKTNQRREAMFFGTNALFTKPAIGVANTVAAWTVTLIASPILAYSMIMGLFPSIALFLSLIFLVFYPNLEETQVMKGKLGKLHAQKGM